jgi:seryl-tRNA synthetase
MRKITFLFLCFALLAIQQVSAQSIFDKWAELKTFHGVMSETFHPSEEGKLEPIKTRSGEMAEKANLLAKSTVPAEFKTEKIQAAVKKLQKDSKALDKLVKNKKSTDEQIKKALASLHDVFHEIVGLCKNEKH